jgi:hypothetical protein
MPASGASNSILSFAKSDRRRRIPSARCASSHIRRAWPTIGGAAAALLRWMKSGAEPSGMREQLGAMDRAGK